MTNLRPSTGSVDLRGVAAPWVELELLNIDERFVPDITLRDGELRLQQQQQLPGSFRPDVAGKMAVDMANLYKKTLMVFRWVASALLHNAGVRETRPALQYRQPAVLALARIVQGNYRILTGDQPGEWRNPLRVLVETVYQGLDTLSDDEATLFYLMLVEAMGIPTRFVIVQQNGSYRAYAECQLDPDSNNWFPVDLTSDQLGVAPKGTNRQHFQAHATKGVPKGRDYGRAPKAIGRLPIRGHLVGSGRTQGSRFWDRPKIRPIPQWFEWLRKEAEHIPDDLHSPFLAKQHFPRAKGAVAENLGPYATGSIIAYMTALYAQRYGYIFRAIARDAVTAQTGGVWPTDPVQLAELLANTVRTIFAYAEETVGVEETATPLRMFLTHTYYPGVQKYDCDDLTACFMALAESCGLRTGVRLAGNPGETDKFHVYPFIMLQNGMRRIYDVSSPLPWGQEMDRGSNFQDFVPSQPQTYKIYLDEQRRRYGTAAGLPVLPRIRGRSSVAGFLPRSKV